MICAGNREKKGVCGGDISSAAALKQIGHFRARFILIDILLVPVVLALYLALKGNNKNAMLAATGFGGLFLVLDLGVTEISGVALITLSQNYAAATNDMQRAATLA